MEKPRTFQEQMDILAHGEVHPLLFATDIERQARLSVHVVMISPPDCVDAGGHSSTLPIFSRYFDMDPSNVVSDDEVRRMRGETIGDFADRLRELLIRP